MDVTLYIGDMRDRVAELATESIDAIVTDPPYHLTTGKKGGSGPASVNLDSPYGRSRIGTGFMGMTWDGGDVAMQAETWALLLRVAKPGAHLVAFGGTRTAHRMWCAIEDAGWEIRDTLMWLYGQGFPKSANQSGAWDGWGTALKPAYEPIVLARRPLAGTVAENLQRYGVGALNIDACRIETTDSLDGSGGVLLRYGGENSRPYHDTHEPRGVNPKSEQLGRWPANVLHDGSDEVVAAFPESDGQLGDLNGDEPSKPAKNVYGEYRRTAAAAARGDRGSAARFFWCPKASRSDRDEGNTHPTVKPTDLMRYLCRLVAPAGGTILDPFMGSGSTGKAAVLEGMHFVGVEREADYAAIAQRRVESRDPLFTRAAIK